MKQWLNIKVAIGKEKEGIPSTGTRSAHLSIASSIEQKGTTKRINTDKKKSKSMVYTKKIGI